MFGDGTQSRCFCHVDDVVRALADLMEREELYGEVFNIGTRVRDHDHAGWPRRSCELVGSELPDHATCRTTRPTRQGFEDMHAPRSRTPRKIREALGWEPNKSLDDIVLDVRDDQLQDSRLNLRAVA